MSSLKNFIKSVRAAKTIADERALVKRESALVRTSLKETQLIHAVRRVNIQKLLYLYILGEKTHFGQIECIKLLASPNFTDKRLGYLATMLLLDENQEVLTLLTNSLNIDMNHPNQFIVGLALATTGNICSPELARDVYTDVERILDGNNNYLKKKAAIVASKIVEKDPDLSEIFLSKVNQLIDAKDHGVLLGCLKLIRSLYEVSPESRPFLISKIPRLIDTLKHLIKASNPEYDIGGLPDPFLQISLVRTLGVMFTDEDQISATSKFSDLLNDVLTSIASYTTFSKNSGSAILHETVKTIFQIPNLDPALKVLGINTLGQLLSTKENNNRYVALNTLLTVVNIEPLAVQRHRQTIVACLSDLDISIKRRALELSFAILDGSNIRILIKEILNFLENPINNDKSIKSYIITNVTNILQRRDLIPNEKWKFDTIIRLIRTSGDSLSSVVVSQLLTLIMNIPNNDELKSYTVNKIFKITYDDSSKEGLDLIAVYLIGEYGDLLINTTLQDETKITDVLLTDFLINLSHLKNDDSNLISYILTCALKLSTKISNQQSLSKLKKLIESQTISIDLNIQIKAVSYLVLFDEPDKIKRGILDRIPPPPIKEKETVSLTNRTKSSLLTHNNNSNSHILSSNNKTGSKTEDLLLDLMDDNEINTNNGNNVDLLQDIFGSDTSKNVKSQTNSQQDILGLFDSNSGIKNKSSNAIEGLNNERVQISFLVKSIDSGHAIIETIITNKTSSVLKNLQLLIAVPKSQKLTMSSLSKHEISANNDITQDLKISGSPGSKVKLRVKFEYDLSIGGHFVETFDFGKITQTL